MKKILLSVLGATLLFGGTTFAQEKEEKKATDYKWQVRARAVGVIPHNKAKIGAIGGQIDIDKNVIPELDFTYFFTKNFAAELILGTSKHNVGTLGSNLTPIGGPTNANVDLGSVWLLPPTLMFQFPLPVDDVFKPYVGAGVNYTIFYDVKHGGVDKVTYKDKFGWGFQVGFDLNITDRLFFNADVKKLFLETDVKVAVAGATVPAKVKLDPLLVGFGLGYRF